MIDYKMATMEYCAPPPPPGPPTRAALPLARGRWGGGKGEKEGDKGKKEEEDQLRSHRKSRDKDWVCGKCHKLNYGRREDCCQCKQPKGSDALYPPHLYEEESRHARRIHADESEIPCRTLMVKGLPVHSNEASVVQALQGEYGVLVTACSLVRDGSRGGASKGTCIVEMSDVDGASYLVRESKRGVGQGGGGAGVTVEGRTVRVAFATDTFASLAGGSTFLVGGAQQPPQLLLHSPVPLYHQHQQQQQQQPPVYGMSLPLPLPPASGYPPGFLPPLPLPLPPSLPGAPPAPMPLSMANNNNTAGPPSLRPAPAAPAPAPPAAAPPAKIRPEWPPTFEEGGGAYTYDVASGYFWEGGSGFFHDPVSKLYYSVGKQAYFRWGGEEGGRERGVGGGGGQWMMFVPPIPGKKDRNGEEQEQKQQPCQEQEQQPLQRGEVGAKVEGGKEEVGEKEEESKKKEEDLQLPRKAVKIALKPRTTAGGGSGLRPSGGAWMGAEDEEEEEEEKGEGQEEKGPAGDKEEQQQQQQDNGSSVSRGSSSSSSSTASRSFLPTLSNDALLPVGASSISTSTKSMPRPLPSLPSSLPPTQIVGEVNGEPVCLLCRRAFNSWKQFRKHEIKSALHAENLAKLLVEGGLQQQQQHQEQEQQEQEQQYRDRAEERRQLYGQDDRPKSLREGGGRDRGRGGGGGGGRERERRRDDRGRDRGREEGREGGRRKPDVEEAGIDKPLGEGNVGHQMLRSFGWKEGEGLGKDKGGITEPIRADQALLSGSKSGVGAGGGGRESGRGRGRRPSAREVYDSKEVQKAMMRARYESAGGKVG